MPTKPKSQVRRVKQSQKQMAAKDTKLNRQLARQERRDNRAAKAQENPYVEAGIPALRVSNALDRMTADLRRRGAFERYQTGAPKPPSDDDGPPAAGDCYVEESSDSAIDVPIGGTVSKAGKSRRDKCSRTA